MIAHFFLSYYYYLLDSLPRSPAQQLCNSIEGAVDARCQAVSILNRLEKETET